MSRYQVILSAEDGEYVQEEFSSITAANAYLVANVWHYGEGQELYIKEVKQSFYFDC